MYNGIERTEAVIDYIETHITEDLDCNVLASKMNLSVYEFRRIFSFIVGCPITEYIRKRRLPRVCGYDEGAKKRYNDKYFLGVRTSVLAGMECLRRRKSGRA